MSLTPADIRVEWPRIKAAATDAAGSYPVEEVYHACRSGRAHLYVCQDGFVVLEQYVRGDTGLAEVNVLLAAGAGFDNLFHKYAGEIADIARKCGAKTLCFRRLKTCKASAFGWRMRATEYEMEL